MKPLPTYEVFALRYATQSERLRRTNFIVTDLYDAPMPVDPLVLQRYSHWGNPVHEIVALHEPPTEVPDLPFKLL